ncbi:MAG: threonine--tRNA ligase, partial [Bacilli bacterium]|nr:threonine--tRNA ligase [Bacilli bacterium]
MKIKYQGNEVELLDNANGFIAAKTLDPENKNKIIAYKVGENVHEMKDVIAEGEEIEFINIESKEGFEMLNHSTSHLMAQAIKHLYPNCKFGFGPSIDEGFYYDVDFGEGVVVREEDFAKIEAEMKKLSKQDIKFERMEVSAAEALEVFKDNEYKQELIHEHENEQISLYKQGDFTDLCRGPHVPSTSYIKHFKLLSVAGAYWRGNSDNKMLTRIYATSWSSEEALKEHLEVLERRKLNDHRRLGKELGLFFISEYGPGFPFFLPKGMLLKNALLDYWRERHYAHGYVQVETPTMLSRELWETSGHWDHYKE